MRKTEAERADLDDVQAWGGRHAPDEGARHREESSDASPHVHQRFAIRVDECQALEVLEVQKEIEAEPWRVAGAEHAEVVGARARLNLRGHSNRRVLAPSAIGQTIVVPIDERRLFEVGVETGVGCDRPRIGAMQLDEKGKISLPLTQPRGRAAA